MKQDEVFLGGEGDNWFERNRAAKINPVVVSEIIKLDIKPKRILEFGCGTGRYLDVFQRHYGCECIGIDPSYKAIEYGREKYPDLRLWHGTTTLITPTAVRGVDILIYGFCLYVCDRNDLFQTVAIGNRMVSDNGYIAIHDFDAGAWPQAVPYHHKEGVFSYKMDYARLWLANPAYSRVSIAKTAEGEAISIIRKGDWSKWQV